MPRNVPITIPIQLSIPLQYMSTENENEDKDLASALGKLGITLDGPRFRRLPATRVDPMWMRYEEHFSLTLFELLALIEARCGAGGY